MALALKEIHIFNVQSISKADLVDLPDTGVIQFYGNNSNGKSILFKFISELVNGTIFSHASRKDLINWLPETPNYCEVLFVRNDNMSLTVHVAEEAAQCWFKCCDINNLGVAERIPSSSKMLPSVVEVFGFHGGKDIQSLNLAEQDDALMFFCTSLRETFNIIDTALTDKTAMSAIEELSRVKQETITMQKKLNDTIIMKNQYIRSLRVENVDELRKREQALLKVLRIIQFKLPKVQLGNIQRPPKVLLFDLPKISKINMDAFPYIPVLEYNSNTEEFLKVIDNLEALRENRCPTCGTQLLGGACDC